MSFESDLEKIESAQETLHWIKIAEEKRREWEWVSPEQWNRMETALARAKGLLRSFLPSGGTLFCCCTELPATVFP